jgi:hypothetical protein
MSLLTLEEYANDTIFWAVFKLIENALAENPAIEKQDIYTKVFATFPNDAEGRFVIDFHQANVIDNYFFSTGVTQYWKEPYGFPSNGDNVFSNTACNVGIFTFNKTLV